MAKSDDSTGGRWFIQHEWDESTQERRPVGTFMGVPVFADEVIDTVCFTPHVALYFPPLGEAYKPTDLSLADLHITIAGLHCGKADCTRCDPMERVVDGLTVRECLERYEAIQRADFHDHTEAQVLQIIWPSTRPLTAAQKDAARVAWSQQLKAKQAEQREKERATLCVDDDRWEP